MAFREIVGHRQLLGLLSRAIARDLLTPSLVLSGPGGVGKRLAAVAVAQALNCVAPLADLEGFPRDACGECAACRRIVRGTHPDVQVIEAGETGSIKIESVRAAVDRAVFRPFEGRRRVTIIDPADALVPAAQNALLKTLEEPLPASVFVLVTSRLDVLLPTVRSRCATLRFGRLNIADVARVLEVRHKYSRADAQTAAAASDGSVRRALDLQGDEVADARDEAERLLKIAGRDSRMRLDQAREMLKGGGSAASEREHLALRLHSIASMLRDAGLLASGGDPRLLANLDRQNVLSSVAQALGPERITRAFGAVAEAHEALERNVGPKVVADWLAVKL